MDANQRLTSLLKRKVVYVLVDSDLSPRVLEVDDAACENWYEVPFESGDLGGLIDQIAAVRRIHGWDCSTCREVIEELQEDSSKKIVREERFTYDLSPEELAELEQIRNRMS